MFFQCAKLLPTLKVTEPERHSSLEGVTWLHKLLILPVSEQKAKEVVTMQYGSIFMNLTIR